MTFKRRDIIGTGAYLLGGSYLTLNGCSPIHQATQNRLKDSSLASGAVVTDITKESGIRLRHSIHNLVANDPNHPDILLYKAGIHTMKYIKLNDEARGNSGWVGMAMIHRDSCPHSNWMFLPWHRAYLAFFERTVDKYAKLYIQAQIDIYEQNESTDAINELNLIDPEILNLPNVLQTTEGNPLEPTMLAELLNYNFALPYWEWELDIPDIAFDDTVFNYTLWGVQDFTRTMRKGDYLDKKSCGKEIVNEILQIEDFDYFMSTRPSHFESTPEDQRAKASYGLLEGKAHNTIHVQVGGKMASMLSPLDPLFWMHHCNVDRIWAEWQRGKGFGLLPKNSEHRQQWLEYEMHGFFDENNKEKTYLVKNTLDITLRDNHKYPDDYMDFTYNTVFNLRPDEPVMFESASGFGATTKSLKKTYVLNLKAARQPEHYNERKHIVVFPLANGGEVIKKDDSNVLNITLNNVPVPDTSSELRRLKFYLVYRDSAGQEKLLHISSHAYFATFLEPKLGDTDGKAIDFSNMPFVPGELDHGGMMHMDMSRVNILDRKILSSKAMEAMSELEIFGIGVAYFKDGTSEFFDYEKNQLNELMEQWKHFEVVLK